MAWLYVPGAVDWNLESDLHSETVTDASVTLRTKPMQPQRWSKEWKKSGWLRLLSGMILSRSTLNRGVAKWISSLPVSPVSPTAKLERNFTAMTQESFQEKSSESPTGLDFQTSFLKMSPASSDSTGTPSDPNYERWVTGLRKDSSRRQKRAHLTAVNGFSSWPTPDTQNFRDGSVMRKEAHGSHAISLHHKVANWPTPDASPRGNRAADLIVEGTNQVRRRKSGQQRGMDLETASANWPTPTTRDYKDGTSAATVPENGLLGRAAPNWANSRSSPQDQPTATDGHTCSPSCRRLNPRFVEWMMGWPDGWSLIDSPCSATEWLLWKQRMRTALSILK
jgi:hypothetical protein